jgi:arylsulfatase
VPTDKPNVLLILADDIGWLDVGAYHRGLMGARTPNIDPQEMLERVMRVAAQG